MWVKISPWGEGCVSNFGARLFARRHLTHGPRTTDNGPRTNYLIQDPKSKTESQVVRLRLVGANPNAAVTGGDELPGKANYFIGNDPKKWRTNVPTYAKVRYQNIYPGVDLVYYGNQSGQLEYDFVVEPGADPGAIALAVGTQGQERNPKLESRISAAPGPPQISPDGDLVISTEGGHVRFHKPVVYQEQSTVDSSQSTVQNQARQSTIVNRQSSIVDRQFHKPLVYQGQESEVRSQEPGAKDEARKSKTDNRQSTIVNRQFRHLAPGT